jgi:hypothetical protein
MQYNKDEKLTLIQKDIKWCIYCELEFECDSDIKAVLNSILKDVK